MKAKHFLPTLLAALVLDMPPNASACTIFVLTDTNHALFCNNEDWSNPKSRIWFVPSTEKRLGCAYVGFLEYGAQGGLNSKGLAFDWVAVPPEKWEPPPELRPVDGASSQRMLETCVTVEDAIAFYRTYREPGFALAKMLVADSSGASVILGATNGQFQVERARHSRGFGFGGRTLAERLATSPEPSVAKGADILRACLQQGQYATKYSSIYNLKTGDIFLLRFPDQPEPVKLNLAVELEKGPHIYDIPKLRKQMAQPPRPFPESMKKVFLRDVRPIPDPEPKVTKHLKTMLHDAAAGKSKPEDYSAEFWWGLSRDQKKIETFLKTLGDLDSMIPVARWEEEGQWNYRYKADFGKATLLQRYSLDRQGKVTNMQIDDIEWKRERVRE